MATPLPLHRQPGTRPPALKAVLPLVRYIPDRRMPLSHRLHILYVLLPYLLVTLPVQIIVKHILPLVTLGFWKSGIKRHVGRWGISDFIARQSTRILCWLNPAQARAIFFSRTWMYKVIFNAPVFWGKKDWVRDVVDAPVRGRWICKPGTKPEEAEMVFYFVHGGGFVVDTGAPAQHYFLFLARALSLSRGRSFAIFQIDYELAPEYIFPSQIVEVQAGYSYLVHKLAISPERIVIGGDSAGGNLILGTLLHWARPGKGIGSESGEGEWLEKLTWNKGKKASELRLVKPRGVYVMSPFISFLSRAASHDFNQDWDYVHPYTLSVAALCYVGGVLPPGPSVTFHPYVHYNPPYSHTDIDVPGVGRVSVADTRFKAFRGDKKKLKEERKLLEKAVRELATNPYVDPALVGKGGVGKGERAKEEELDWWREALPGQGRTLLCWGGREVMNEDQDALCKVWEEAGIKPVRFVKPYGVHDWVLYDYVIPFAYKTKSNGPDASLWWGVERAADWFEEVFPKGGKGKGKQKLAEKGVEDSWVSVKDEK